MGWEMSSEKMYGGGVGVGEDGDSDASDADDADDADCGEDSGDGERINNKLDWTDNTEAL